MQVLLEVSVQLRYLFQDEGNRGKGLLKMYAKLLNATIYRHAKKQLADKTVDKIKYNHGRLRRVLPQNAPNPLPNTHTSREIWVFYSKTIGS